MKVKIFSDNSVPRLETQVNEFLATLREGQVIDIKYAASESYSEMAIVYNETKAAD